MAYGYTLEHPSTEAAESRSTAKLVAVIAQYHLLPK